MKEKLNILKYNSGKFAAYFRRNQLMLTVTATFILLFILTVWGVLASQARSELELQRREEFRQQITNVEKRIECLGEYFQYLNRHQLIIRSYHPCRIERLKPGEKPPILEIPREDATEPDQRQPDPDNRPQGESFNISKSNPNKPSPNLNEPEPPEDEMNPVESLIDIISDGLGGTLDVLRNIL